MFDQIKKWLGRDKETSAAVRMVKTLTEQGTLHGTKKRKVKREKRDRSRFLLRSGRFVTRYSLRCLEISGMDVLTALARRNDRVKYVKMKRVV